MIVGSLLGSAAAYCWFWKKGVDEVAGAMVLGYTGAAFLVVGLWTLLTRPHPRPSDLRRPDLRTAWYHSTPPTPPPSLPILTACAFAAAVISPLSIYPLLPREPLVALFGPGMLSLVASLLLVPVLGLGYVRVLFARDRTMTILSLGYCEAEVIAGGDVEIPGFQELCSFPIEHGELPGLQITVGYFPPGVYRVEFPERDLLFLRTRGFCLLRVPCGLPKDRDEVFGLVESWERFSMVYAALAVRDGRPPDPDEEEDLARHVERNVREGMRVRYFGVEFHWGKLLFSKWSVGCLFLAILPPLLLALLVKWAVGLTRPASTACVTLDCLTM